MTAQISTFACKLAHVSFVRISMCFQINNFENIILVAKKGNQNTSTHKVESNKTLSEIKPQKGLPKLPLLCQNWKKSINNQTFGNSELFLLTALSNIYQISRKEIKIRI